MDALLPGKRLYMLATGTGIAPFASLIRDPNTYERYEQVILTQTCRQVAELQYGYDLVKETMEDPLVGEYLQAGKLIHDAAATREDYKHTRRLTAVSYTHLDVYKRQILFICVFLTNWAGH